MKGFTCFVSLHTRSCGQLQSFMYVEAANVLEAKLWAISEIARINRGGVFRKLMWMEEEHL